MLDGVVHLSSDALFQEIGGEGVILDLATSTYYGLDEVGARCWQLLQENPSLEFVGKTILDEYEVEPQRLESDITDLVTRLVDSGLATLA